ncbi:hypothetical protein AAFF_G00224910 [Aldrovandia affinis]|uniref:Eukaryotic translation initiation factor 3 subunit J n=1 Tax=Aldrovandia affinis TaxID=143900 RepID=A0AAD7TCA1_9TELE|nr:hypothetical protein AAFF_G00224910 [Aldrovandia affinis]
MADGDSWDTESFEPDESTTKVAVLDKWEGEDEDEDVKDNWDDDEEEKKAEEKKTEVKVSDKKKLSEKIKEKESRQRKKEEIKPTVPFQIEEVELTPEEAAAEKLRVMKLQEDADLELAMDAFAGVTNNVPVSRTSEIDALSPSSKDDFTELQKLLKDKLSQYESSVHYSSFLESLFRDLCISLEVDDLKKISTSLTVLLSEKQKQEKQNKAKQKKKKGVLPAGGLKAKLKDDLADYGDFDGGYNQDYEDFM